ncbi:dienelactone hydrolase family protein [Streptomyces monticola]|uniref:Dienelactone hydrolase family protein n=1 Tax=Streptomyces monticola TaxID=2666263 RepID=A0ABW2JCH5_9ACTN
MRHIHTGARSRSSSHRAHSRIPSRTSGPAHSRIRSRAHGRLRLWTAAAAVITATVLVPQPALAGPPQVRADAANPYERGPDPTEESITAERGPFAVQKVDVPAGSGQGFNRGTITYPTDTSEGTFGAVAVSPGFVSPEAFISWLGPRLASQGFVVITIDTNTPFDFPDARADQLLAALDYLTTKSAVKDRIDPQRLAVMGHSMGGGASLRASAKRPQIQAAVPLAPWHTTSAWDQNKVPTMIIGAESDFIAPVAMHAEPFYENLKSAPEKAYLEMKGADHMAPALANVTTAKYGIAWLKRFVDDDTRYDQFLCPPPKPSPAIGEYRDTCPNG